MRILFTIGRYWPTIGGGELHTRELVRHLSERHEIEVACLRNDNCTDWLYGMTLRPPRRRRPYRDGRTRVRLVRLGLARRMLLRRTLASYYRDEAHKTSCKRTLASLFLEKLDALGGPFDLVHNVMIGEEFFSLASLLLARRRGVPFAFTPISHPDGWRGEVFSQLYREADLLVAMTEAEKEFLVSQGGRPETVLVAGAGPLLKSLAPSSDAKATLGISGPAVLVLGQKYPYKGIAQVLDAAPRVWERFPAAHFIFAGPRVEATAHLFAQGRDRRIVELGTVSEEEKADLLAACDVFCLPSVCESFGMVYLEAWSFGKPVIAADTATSRSFISHGEDGLLVRQEGAAVAEAIAALLGDAGLRARLGARGRLKATTRYAWPSIAASVEAAYARALRERGAGAGGARP